MPSKIFDSLNLQRPEIGVDLIAESNEGNLWAIQCIVLDLKSYWSFAIVKDRKNYKVLKKQ